MKKKTEVRAYNFSYLYPSLLFPGKSQFETDFNEEEYAKPVLHSSNPFKWKKAANEILKDNPDHLIICYWHPYFAPAFMKVVNTLKKNNPRIRIHLLAHNVVPHEKFPMGEILSKRLINQSDNLIVISEKSTKEAENLGVKTNVTKLFHPVYEQSFPEETESELRTKYGVEEVEHVFLFFGLIRSYKGLDIMIKALNKIDLKKHKIRPLIAGEFYANKNDLLSMIKSEHRDFYIIVDRFVSDYEMAEIFTISDVLVMPYKSATQSGILANAINFNVPVIVSSLTGLTEHVHKNVNAFTFEPGDIEGLKNDIIKLTDKKTREAFKEALKPLKSDLSWSTFSDELLHKISKENP
ncbi:glycosyltransferase [Gracilimonas sp.]|uniref:glycosyltransferase n=1 Tax=Gracilimonas sp. TaxID=1974203 RepID=UPI002872507F|nr:glycosyltransferase [Gracilimonas sp.]